jgi:hypothetical protein
LKAGASVVFNTYFCKSQLEEQIYRASKMPGPGDYNLNSTGMERLGALTAARPLNEIKTVFLKGVSHASPSRKDRINTVKSELKRTWSSGKKTRRGAGSPGRAQTVQGSRQLAASASAPSKQFSQTMG